MSIKLTRWDYLDSKTNTRFSKIRGGVLSSSDKNKLAALITRPAMLIQQLYVCLQESPKLDADQKKLCKYILLFIDNGNVYGRNAASKVKPCIMGFTMHTCKALTSFPIETLNSMEMLAKEDNLLSVAYTTDNNQNEYKMALSLASTERLSMKNSILIRRL